MCGPLSGISGGDLHALRLVQEWNEREPGSALLLGPARVMMSLPAKIGEDDIMPVRTPLDRWMRGLVTYAVVLALRAVVAAFKAPPARFSIAASHFVQDVIPVVFHGRRHGSQPVVYVYHLVGDMKRPRGLRSWLSEAAERVSLALMRASRAVVFVDNEDTIRSLESRGFDPGRLVSTRNAYDPVGPLPLRSRPKRPRVAFVGRFTEEKGVWDMLELARALGERLPDARVAMLGDGPLRRELLERAAGLGLRNLEAPGFVDEETKWRALRDATLFVAPSREEGWGIAVGEALTAEVPVVGFDLPAYGHFGDLPIRVPAGEVRQLIHAVLDLLTNAGRLEREQERVREAAEMLPKWHEILDADIAALEGRADPSAVSALPYGHGHAG
jgi:glycosyltransferase involved in cell wall biosynthesis